jgi:SWIM zinc finger
MKVVQETTDWGNVASPNHVYFLNDSRDKMFAYLPKGSTQVKQFKNPISFYTRGRRFQEVPNSWGFAPEQATGRTWRVAGSKGSEYTVTDDQGKWTCTCPAAKWQAGDCKHIKSLQPVL